MMVIVFVMLKSIPILIKTFGGESGETWRVPERVQYAAVRRSKLRELAMGFGNLGVGFSD